MSSFVRAVLSASGALTPKEDLSATISRLSKRGEELKSLLRVEVESRYETLGSNKDIQGAIDKLEAVKGEMESLQSALQLEVAEKASEEMESLLLRLEELSGTIEVAGSIRDAWGLLEKMEECLGVGNNVLGASQISRELWGILQDEGRMANADEDQEKAFQAIRQEYISSKDILKDALSSSWDTFIYVEPKKAKHSAHLYFNAAAAEFQELLSAMQSADLLSDKLKIFSEALLAHVLSPVMTQKALIHTESAVCLKISVDPSSAPNSPYEVFDQLQVIFSFLTAANPPLSLSEESTFIGALSEIIRERFMRMLIDDILSAAVPVNNKELERFTENMGNAVDSLESALKGIGFLPEDCHRLTSFIQDIQTVFINKKLCNYLQEARGVMTEPLYETMEVSPEVIKEENALLKLQSKVGAFPLNEDDLPLPDKDVLSAGSNPFTFPKCRISKAAWALKSLIYKVLDEAAETPDNIFLTSRLVQGSRYIFQLYLNMVLTVHESDFQKLPQVSALAHNDCFFLAHTCMLLGFHYRDFIPLDGRGGCQFLTYIDFLPPLRETGEKILKRQIEAQRSVLLGHVSEMDINSTTSPETVFRRLNHGLTHLKKVWGAVLPGNVYPRIMGTLINSTLEALIQKVVVLDNIVADSAVQTYNAFSEFGEALPALFEEEHQPLKYVRYWLRFKELVFILNANLREIEHRWAERKGPLASEFSVDEIKRLIRAIFQNTERRATVLSRIK